MDNNAKKPFLQRIEGFVFISCLYVFFQGGYASGFIPVTLGVWEKVFRLTALETSPAVSSYTFAKLASAIPLTYFCSPGHIPKHLAWQCAICALSALITAIPWIAAQAESSTPVANLCYVGGHPDAASCDKKVDSSGLQYFVFVGQAMNGMAGACMYTLIPAYINANAAPSLATRYVAYFFACGPLGVAFGFIVMGTFATETAWGVPYLVVAVVLAGIVPFYHFKLPKTMTDEAPNKEILLASVSSDGNPDAEDGVADMNEKAQGQSLNDFLKNAKLILSNRVFWWFSAAASVEAFFVVGINNYGPKIFASYFSMNPSTASLLAGGLLVPAAVFGQLAGGVVDSKRSKSLSDTSGLTKKIAAVALVLVLLLYSIQCDTLSFENQDDCSSNGNATTNCNCFDKFEPVCENGEKLHFSGCYAGCTEYSKDSGEYSNCGVCGKTFTSVKAGICDSLKCNKLPLTIVLFFIAIFATFANNPPSQMVMMRIVPAGQSANALAVNDLIYRVLGNIPGVPVWAAMVDSTCKHWNKDVCGDQGSCAYYDNGQLSTVVLLLGGIPKLLSLLFFGFGAWNLANGEYKALGTKPYADGGGKHAAPTEKGDGA